MANYRTAPWGNPVYGTPNRPITSAPGRLPNPIGEEGYRLLKSRGGTIEQFLVTQEDLARALCNHRHNGNFDVTQDPDLPGLYRCNICQEIIDLHTKYDPVLVQKIIDHLWAVFNSLKTNNNGVVSNVIMSDLANGMLMVKQMPKMLKAVNANYEKNAIQQQQYQQQQYRGANPNMAVNMIINGGHDYVAQGQYDSRWQSPPQDIIQQQQAYYQQQAAPVYYQQPQQPYYAQPSPFAAGSGQQPQYPQGQPVVYPQQGVVVPYDGVYSPAVPTPGQVYYPQGQPQQYQPAPQQVPPQAAATVVPEVRVPPQPTQPVQPQPAPQPTQPQQPGVTKVFKK